MWLRSFMVFQAGGLSSVVFRCLYGLGLIWSLVFISSKVFLKIGTCPAFLCEVQP